MSNLNNTELLERASAVIDATTGMSWIPERIEQLIKENNLDELRRLVNEIEANLAIEHFYDNNILEANDAF